MDSQASHFLGPDEQLREAKRHMEDLASSWRSANDSRPAVRRARAGSGRAFGGLRLALGGAIVRFGRAMAGGESQSTYRGAADCGS